MSFGGDLEYYLREDVDYDVDAIEQSLLVEAQANGYSPEEIAWFRRVIDDVVKPAHAGQMRKSTHPRSGERIDFVVHPLRVARKAIRLKLDAVLVVTELAHDTLEDTEQKYWLPNQLVATYGDADVVSLAELLSKDLPTGKLKLWEYYERMRDDPRAILLKALDRTDNLRDMLTQPQCYSSEKVLKKVAEARGWITNELIAALPRLPERLHTVARDVLKTLLVVAQLAEERARSYWGLEYALDSRSA